ncbi:AraC family transcriptional regulator [Bordetella sp. 2513F-2]
MKPTTRRHYVQRLLPVLDWLAQHPDASPDLYRLAELACLSPYHFHRVYRALMGETVAATAQRMRMARASAALARNQGTLEQVASRAGYASIAAFNRAFGSAFGVPPGRYRAQRSSPRVLQEPAMYPIHIEHFPGLTLAALPHRGDYQAIGQAFDRLLMLAAAAGLQQPGIEARSIGVYYDDPAQVPVTQLRAHAGMAMPAGQTAAAGLETLHIPAMRCAVLAYTGPYSDLESAYAWLFGTWLPASGETPGDFPVFEEYVDDPRHTPAASLRTLIRLPLA